MMWLPQNEDEAIPEVDFQEWCKGMADVWSGNADTDKYWSK